MNTGDTGFIMICAALVFFMTPGLAFFYGGLVRRKNVVNTIMACTAIMGLSVVMWVLFGYSLSFGTNHGGVIGDLKWFALNVLLPRMIENTRALTPELICTTFPPAKSTDPISPRKPPWPHTM